MATDEKAGGGGPAKPKVTKEELQKLRLSKEKLKDLNDAELEAIVAGAASISEGTICAGYWRVFT